MVLGDSRAMRWGAMAGAMPQVVRGAWCVRWVACPASFDVPGHAGAVRPVARCVTVAYSDVPGWWRRTTALSRFRDVRLGGSAVWANGGSLDLII